MRIAICDDEVRGRERIRTLLEKEFSQAQRSEFDSGMKLLEAVEKGYQPDIDEIKERIVDLKEELENI